MNKLTLLSIGIITVTLAGVALMAIPKKDQLQEVFIIQSELSHIELKEHYEQWKSKYQLSKQTLLGDSEYSETYRLTKFKENLLKISDHNKKFIDGHYSFTMKLNQFTHLSSDEFQELHLSDLSYEEDIPKQYLPMPASDQDLSYINNVKEPTNLISNNTIPLWKKIIDLYVDAFKYFFSQSSDSERPMEIDWRNKMHQPLEQGGCGSCYTFATTSAIQAVLGSSKLLSTQELVDCDNRNKGCKGGIPQNVYSYASYLGITYDEEYPYIQRQRPGCGVDYNDTSKRLKISTYYDVQSNAESLETALKYAPVTAAIDAKSLQMYGSGIYDFPCSLDRNEANHAVVVVGYTSEYFLIRNSWGVRWGEEGHFKVRKESNNKGTCGLYNDMSFPYVNK
ncbi:hypothetical protein ABPG72_001279 [Tetrahymena utriculariae]